MSGLNEEASAHPDLLLGFEAGDDAAVYRLNDDTALVLTVDFFAPIVDDPYDFGAIAATNALSDVYAVGGQPLAALNIAAFPRSLPLSIASEIMRGGAQKVREAGALIVGGHTVDDAEPKYGLAVIGTVEPGSQVENATSQPGDALVLTKPIGTGIIATACKNGSVDKDVLLSATASMLGLNRAASEAMVEVGANAATDITGFGLIGHLMTMMRASGTTARLRRANVPVLPGVIELLADGVISGGTQRNLEACASGVAWGEGVSEEDQLLMCDAQTSGGLLISLPSERVESLLDALRSRGARGTIVGEVMKYSGIQVEVAA